MNAFTCRCTVATDSGLSISLKFECGYKYKRVAACVMLRFQFRSEIGAESRLLPQAAITADVLNCARCCDA